MSYQDLLLNDESFNSIVKNKESLFKKKIDNIEDDTLKSNLLKILKFRLSGNIPDFISFNDNYNYNW